jgi:hypothetical protein
LLFIGKPAQLHQCRVKGLEQLLSDGHHEKTINRIYCLEHLKHEHQPMLFSTEISFFTG